MTDSSETRKDEGIHEVLAKANERAQPVNSSENEVDEQNGHENAKPQDLVESGDNKVIESSQTEELSRMSSKDVTNGDISQSNADLKLDLTDPESVIQMLETVDLTEEDTEGLLQEAYNMNRKLKEMLRRQEMEALASGATGSKSKPKAKLKPKQAHDSSTSSTNSSEPGSRGGSAFGARKILPPISGEKEKSVYAIKLKRSRTNIVDTRATVSEAAVPRSMSTKPEPRKVFHISDEIAYLLIYRFVKFNKINKVKSNLHLISFNSL